MTKLREEARGRVCQVRLPGCDGGGESTVLAHYSLAGVSGRGYKSPDSCGAWCCYPCHQAVDGQRYIVGYSRDQIRLALAEGIVRTLAVLHTEGYELKRAA